MRRAAAILELERRIEKIEARPRSPGGIVRTGMSALDDLLPEGGLPRGQVVEWTGARSSGKTTLLRNALAGLRAAGESVALIDAARTLYASDWDALITGEGEFWVIRPPAPVEAAWCVDLVLRSGAFGAVALLAVERSSRHDDEIPMRRGVTARLQRLAEEAGAVLITSRRVPLAALRLSFRAGRIEPVRDAFGPFLSSVRPVWVSVDKHGSMEVPLLCPVSRVWNHESTRDRKGPRI